MTDDLRDRISDAIGPTMRFGLQDAELHDEPGEQRINEWVTWIADAVLAEVTPELERLRGELATERARTAEWRRVHEAHNEIHDIGENAITKWRKRAEQAEAERDALRSRLTGVAIHAHRLKTRIAPGTDAWSVFEDLRAAMDAPSDAESPEDAEEAFDVGDLPGMWEQADLTGGETDSAENRPSGAHSPQDGRTGVPGTATGHDPTEAPR